jgi:hypothetical protein
MSDLHYSLRSIWPLLPILPKLYFMILAMVGVYTVFSASVIVVRLHSLTKHGLVENAYSHQSSLSALRTRAANMRQLLGATFYLFGLAFFLILRASTFVSELSRTPTDMIILRNFLVDFAFAANVFLVPTLCSVVRVWSSPCTRAACEHSNLLLGIRGSTVCIGPP